MPPLPAPQIIKNDVRAQCFRILNFDFSYFHTFGSRKNKFINRSSMWLWKEGLSLPTSPSRRWLIFDIIEAFRNDYTPVRLLRRWFDLILFSELNNCNPEMIVRRLVSLLLDYTRRARVAPKRLFVFGTLELDPWRDQRIWIIFIVILM